jgi:hypothetical protein
MTYSSQTRIATNGADHFQEINPTALPKMGQVVQSQHRAMVTTG